MSTGTADPGQAVTKAATAVRDAEAGLAGGNRFITADGLRKLRTDYDHARLAAEGAKVKADRAAESARLAALAELGRQVDALAAAGEDMAAEQLDDLRAIADICARSKGRLEGWDASVRDLIAEAGRLGVGGSPPGGPSKASGYLAIGLGAELSITHHQVRLTLVGTELARAFSRAERGLPEEGIALLNGVTELSGPPRPRRVFHSTRGGGYHPVYDDRELSDGWLAQIKSGDLEELDAGQIEAWLRGELS